MPKESQHWDGTRHVSHRNIHNLYGMMYHNSTVGALQQRGYDNFADGDRPFVLTRSFFAGTQRLGVVWSGDNQCKWE